MFAINAYGYAPLTPTAAADLAVMAQQVYAASIEEWAAVITRHLAV